MKVFDPAVDAARRYRHGKAGQVLFWPMLLGLLCAVAFGLAGLFPSGADRAVIGLCLDIVGAFVLGRGLVFKATEHAEFEAATMMGGNAIFIRSAMFQRAEAQVGTVFLVAGFWAQLAGTVTPPGTVPRLVSTGAVLLTLLVVSVLGVVACHVGNRRAAFEFYTFMFRLAGMRPDQLKEHEAAASSAREKLKWGVNRVVIGDEAFSAWWDEMARRFGPRQNLSGR